MPDNAAPGPAPTTAPPPPLNPLPPNPPPPPEPWLAGDFAIQAVSLTKRFGQHRAVDGITLRVPTGTFYGLLGPNGAG
ncbi:MAG: ABC transporter ATP-binding protein, partial [Acidimicrobiia bacterium]|nr:ABC transporter ATP-binding protein [Acidimicrobiia bacterium]